MFSKSCEYGIKAFIYITKRSLIGERVKIGEVSTNIEAPEAHTAKIMTSLIKQKLLESKTSRYGGFKIEIDKMKTIMVSDVVFALDGDSVYKGCGLGLKECDASKPCPLHNKFVTIREELRQTLETTSIYDLASTLKAGQTMLLR